ncbi:hypothetical protein ACFVKB_45090 [Rhodococcus sp. NPDC127530]|uniref:hypothetical protein n=1 Tax=unclassified Rhodococcus (in: high G+C Gram-positive bacteria) TaxID=192944 RepID=UPI003631672E
MEEAERRLDQSSTLGTQGGTVDFMVATYAVGAQLKFRLGRHAEAEARLQEGERLSVVLNLPRLEAHITMCGFALASDPRISLVPNSSRFTARNRAGISRVSTEIMEESRIRLLLAEGTDRSAKQARSRARNFAESIDAPRRPRAFMHDCCWPSAGRYSGRVAR